MPTHLRLLLVSGLLMLMAGTPDEKLNAAKQTSPASVSVGLVIRAAPGVAQARTGAKTAPLTLGDDLYAGQTISVEKTATQPVLLFWHNRGPRFQLPPGAAVRVLSTGLEALSGPPPVKLSSATPAAPTLLSDIRRRRPREGGLLSSTNRAFPASGSLLFGPIGAVATPRPPLRWYSQASKVSLLVYRTLKDEKPIEQTFGKAYRDKENRIAFPAKMPDLKPGRLYKWVLVPEADEEGSDPDTAEGYFWLLDPTTRTALNRLRAAIKASPQEAEAHIILIRTLIDAGCFEEATNRAQESAKRFPDDAAMQQLSARMKQFWERLVNGKIEKKTPDGNVQKYPHEITWADTLTEEKE